MKDNNYLHSDITEKIIEAFYKVYNELGYGFLEKVYENAMSMELIDMHFNVTQQGQVDVMYSGKSIGSYYADLIIENKVIVELKSVESIHPAHEAQLVNYLRCSNIEVDLLLNFGPKPEIRRKVLSKDFKKVN